MRYCTLEEAAAEIRDGDLLLFRARGWQARIIAAAGRSAYSHAARALWWEETLFCCEVREWYGGRAVTLASQVARSSGRIDVFEVNPDGRWPTYDRQAAVRAMRALAGVRYGYGAVLRATWRRTLLGRWCSAADAYAQEANGGPLFCSQACALVDRAAGGVDPAPHLADCFTEPGDLARSLFYRYRCTLVATGDALRAAKEPSWNRMSVASRARAARRSRCCASSWPATPISWPRWRPKLPRIAAKSAASTAHCAAKDAKWGS